MIRELDRLAGNVEFRWGLLVGVGVTIVVLVVSVLLWQRRYWTGVITVVVALVLSALAASGGRDDLEDHLRGPSFRWGVLGGVLLVAALATWLVLLARRRWILAGALVGIAALFTLTVAYRSGIDDLLGNDSFRRGMLAGALVVAGLVVVAVAAPYRRLGVASLGLVAAAFVALAFAGLHPDGQLRLLASSVGLAIAGIVASRLHWTMPLRVLSLVPGAVLVGATIGATESFASATLVTVVVLVTAAAVGSPTLVAGCTEPLILAITFGGVYVCVPETALAVVVFGAAMPFVATGWPARVLENGAALPAIAGLVVWLAFTEGRPRDGAIVGAVACLGVLLLQPVLSRLRTPPPAGAIVLVHGLLVTWCARVAGLRHGALPAVLIAALGAAVALGVLQAAPWQAWGEKLRSIVRAEGDG